MQRALPAIALCAVLHTAMAGTPGAVPAHAGALPPSAAGALAAQARTPPAHPPAADTVAVAVAMQGGLRTTTDASAGAKDTEEPHDHPTAMLLAAVALMTGIALRRRGAERE